MTRIIVRPAKLSDISEILPMVAKICTLHRSWDPAKYDFLPQPEQLYQSWIKTVVNNNRNLCLVAEAESAIDQSKLVAFLIATVEREIPIYSLKEYAFIHDLWVEDDYRRAGIAKQMVMQAIDHFTKVGIAQIRLDTAIANETARHLFTSCGFRPSDIEMLVEL